MVRSVSFGTNVQGSAKNVENPVYIYQTRAKIAVGEYDGILVASLAPGPYPLPLATVLIYVFLENCANMTDKPYLQ